MSEQEYQNKVQEAGPTDILGSTDHEQRRAPEGDGSKAPLTTEGGENAQFSIYDGKGNENVVVVADDPKGRSSAGTGHTSAEALEDAQSNEEIIGDLYEPKE